MQLERGNFCPLIQGPCKQLECMWFTQIRGKHPQTGQDLDEYNCSMSWMPILMIENSSQQRNTWANIAEFKNEMMKSNEQSQQLLLQASLAQRDDLKLIE